jgi:HJR/Mrr/RecB family endonuclease
MAWILRRRGRRELAGLERLDDRTLGLRLEAAYWRLGYRVQRPREDPSGLILARNGVRTAVHARSHVDEEVVRAAAASGARHGCERTVVATPARLRDGVHDAARRAGVQLLERKALLHLLASARDS